MTATDALRAIADMALAHSEQGTRRFYSMSAQIRRERSNYSGGGRSTSYSLIKGVERRRNQIGGGGARR